MSPGDHPVVRLGEDRLGLPELLAVARGGARVEVATWEALDAGRAWLDERLAEWTVGEGAPIYGVTTGFGSCKNIPLGRDEVEQAISVDIAERAAGGGEVSATS